MHDLVIHGGRVTDDSGALGVRADVVLVTGALDGRTSGETPGRPLRRRAA